MGDDLIEKPFLFWFFCGILISWKDSWRLWVFEDVGPFNELDSCQVRIG